MAYAWIIEFVLLAFAAFAMWRYTVVKEKIARQLDGAQTRTGTVSRYDAPKEDAMQIEVPDYFDEQRIKEDLARLAEMPGMLAKYVERARSRFTKASQRAVLEHYIALCQTGKRAIDARTELERSNNTYQQLEVEREIKHAEKQTRLSELEAQREEHIVRKAKAINERKELEREHPTPKKSEHEKQFDEYRSRRLYDVKERLFEQMERMAFERIEARKLHKDLTLQIDQEPDLSPDDKYEIRQWLDRMFEASKKDAGIFANEEY